MNKPWWAKPLRILAIVLMTLTAAFTILGGAGTTCVALNPTGFSGSFAGIAPSSGSTSSLCSSPWLLV